MVDMFLLLTVGHKISGCHNILTGLWYPSFSSGELRIESDTSTYMCQLVADWVFFKSLSFILYF